MLKNFKYNINGNLMVCMYKDFYYIGKYMDSGAGEITQQLRVSCNHEEQSSDPM